MTPKTLALASLLLLIGTTARATVPVADSLNQRTDANVSDLPQETPEMRYANAQKEYAIRLGEFKAGRSPANAAIKPNKRLLEAALALGRPNAAIEYDQRAAIIESYAKTNLELRTGTEQEVAQAQSARLDAILKRLLDVSDSRPE